MRCVVKWYGGRRVRCVLPRSAPRFTWRIEIPAALINVARVTCRVGLELGRRRVLMIRRHVSCFVRQVASSVHAPRQRDRGVSEEGGQRAVSGQWADSWSSSAGSGEQQREAVDFTSDSFTLNGGSIRRVARAGLASSLAGRPASFNLKLACTLVHRSPHPPQHPVTLSACAARPLQAPEYPRRRRRHPRHSSSPSSASPAADACTAPATPSTRQPGQPRRGGGHAWE